MGADSVRRMFPRTGYLSAISCLQALSQRSCVPVGAGLPAMTSVGCQCVRGVCIAGKPGSYSWSWLACDGVGGVSVSSRRLYRGQAPLLQLELACLRWRRWGAREFAAAASRASPAPTVGAGLPAMASVGCQCVRGVCIAGKPGSYSWSWLACDGFGGVSVSSRRLYRGQARLLQLELACLR